MHEKEKVEFFSVGTPVLFRGRYSAEFSIRGVVEICDPLIGYGIRLENGNFSRALPHQVKLFENTDKTPA